MGKWTTIYTNATKSEKTDAEKRAAARAFVKATAKTQPRSIVQMKEESDKLYAAKLEREASLLAAYDAKKLKSKALIKEAKALAAARDKAAEKSDKKVVAEATA